MNVHFGQKKGPQQQFLGRVLSCLPVDSVDFMAPPFRWLDPASENVIVAVKTHYDLEIFPTSARGLLTAMLASVVGHGPRVITALSTVDNLGIHPIHNIALFQGDAVFELRRLLDPSRPTNPTGILLGHRNLEELQYVKKQIKNLRETELPHLAHKIVSDIDDMFEKRGAAAGHVTR